MARAPGGSSLPCAATDAIDKNARRHSAVPETAWGPGSSNAFERQHATQQLWRPWTVHEITGIGNNRGGQDDETDAV